MKLMINLHLEQEAVVAGCVTEDQKSRIQAVSENVDITVPGTVEERAVEMPDTEVIFGNFNPSMFSLAKSLRWVQSVGAGVDGILFDDFVKSDIVFTSAKGQVGTHLADHAWGLLLALTRGIARSVREKTAKSQYSIRAESWELGGKTLGVLGLGGTGVEVARRAQGFGMRVIATDTEEVEKPSFVEELWPADRFYDVLEASDIVAICLPLTPKTRGLFDRKAFSRMRSHALLINVTRGGIMDGPSLMEALENRTIGGAGLDVTPEEPLPEDSPLWNMSNVVVTPHTAGGSPERFDRMVDLLCANLGRYLKGESLLSVIDKEKGY
ncbi:MAG: D-2-hydroxyacid dehydrogenase [Dehalococcoidia bacterium]